MSSRGGGGSIDFLRIPTMSSKGRSSLRILRGAEGREAAEVAAAGVLEEESVGDDSF